MAYPASEPSVIAVSALGRKGTFPAHTTETSDVAAPFGSDRHNFIAAFSNVGPEIDLTGPGVGIISTIVGGYAVMDGTSMACPAVTGVAARLLGASPEFQAARNANRSDAVAQLLLNSATTLGFKPNYEGHGLPR